MICVVSLYGSPTCQGTRLPRSLPDSQPLASGTLCSQSNSTFATPRSKHIRHFLHRRRWTASTTSKQKRRQNRCPRIGWAVSPFIWDGSICITVATCTLFLGNPNPVSLSYHKSAQLISLPICHLYQETISTEDADAYDDECSDVSVEGAEDGDASQDEGGDVEIKGADIPNTVSNSSTGQEIPPISGAPATVENHENDNSGAKSSEQEAPPDYPQSDQPGKVPQPPLETTLPEDMVNKPPSAPVAPEPSPAASSQAEVSPAGNAGSIFLCRSSEGCLKKTGIRDGFRNQQV